MRTVMTHREAFNAAHLIEDAEFAYGSCSNRLHGHDWYADIVVASEPDPRTGLPPTDAPRHLRALLDEIDGEYLNDMLPGLYPTPAGIAHWLVERSRMHVPGLISITVGHTGHAVTVEV